MKRKVSLIAALLLLMCTGMRAQRTCFSYDYLQQQLLANPYMQGERDAIEAFTAQYVSGACAHRKMVVRIPVVFHVLYQNATENISNARIMEQLATLNRDYGRYNADAGNTPANFTDEATDTEIQFCLATRDPNCAPTTGILRIPTTVGTFNHNTDQMKFTSMGGSDIWPRDEYLNIWVCDMASWLLGYAQFPGGAAATDGVVLHYTTVGGPSAPGTNTPYHLGRTATHEVGHWLNLNHIWGDDADNNGTCDLPHECTGTDNVADTPNQCEANGGCPTYPLLDGCTTTGDGVMFMNYMDYVDDNCMNMFTQGQSDRMHACLESFREGLFGSLGCTPGQTPVDLWVRDSWEDIGNEVNWETGSVMWDSPDIWVRNTADGNPYHQNPLHTLSTNTVYVRILNKGCSASTGNEKLNVYWTKASTVGPWPGAWNNTEFFPCGSNPVKGKRINPSPISIPVIPPSGSVVIPVPWNPVPNPADYVCASPAGEHWHFCLAARIETSPTPPYGMTFAEGSDIGTNARNNNNIAWKNLQIDPPTIGTLVASNAEVATAFDLIYSAADNELLNPLVNNATITINLGQTLYTKWVQGGQLGRGFAVEQGQDYTIRLTEPFAAIENLMLEPEDWGVPIWQITFEAENNGPKCIYLYHVMLRNHLLQTIVGGVTYEIHKPVCVAPDAGPDQYSCPGCPVQLNVQGEGELATYQWRDLNTGLLVGEQATVVVNPAVTTTYEVRRSAEDGCIDRDEVTVHVNGVIGKMAGKGLTFEAMPNPFGALTRIRFTLPETCAADLKVYDELGREVATLFDGTAQGGKPYELEFKPNGIEKGVYIARLNACGHEARFVKLIYLD